MYQRLDISGGWVSLIGAWYIRCGCVYQKLDISGGWVSLIGAWYIR